MDKEEKRKIILDNYINPYHKKSINDKNYIKINSNNESCIDDLDLYFKINDEVISDIYFNGEACAIATSAASIICKTFINKTKKEAREILYNYENMINEKSYQKELLKDLLVYDDIYLQPNRKTCALLPAKAIEKILDYLK